MTIKTRSLAAVVSCCPAAVTGQVIAAAVREYIDTHRDEINDGVKAALGRLNGTDAAAVSLMTGLSADELADLGGLRK